MRKVNGINNESLILDGEWLEKHRAGEVLAKLSASAFRSVDLSEIERRKKIFGREKERLVQAILEFDQPPIVSLTVPVEKRPELDELLAELESASQG